MPGSNEHGLQWVLSSGIHTRREAIDAARVFAESIDKLDAEDKVAAKVKLNGHLIQGQSEAFWQRERIRDAWSILSEWDRVEATAGTGAFVVKVDRFVDMLDAAMERFRDIPGQDVACGLFQLGIAHE